jgi:hypothetical protein
MSRTILAKYVTPWKFRREQEARRVAALRQRDGDDCRRCRRPIRFDLTAGHDKGPKVETSEPVVAGEEEIFDNLFLCHGRCNAAGADNTAEVAERIRRRSEAELFAKARA